MRSFILLVVGCAILVGGLPSRTSCAQSNGGLAQLSSAAYQPDSPVKENRLFKLQTGHYGFAYNCDGEEDKRNHPAICWRRADADQLPKRMGCLARVRHEVAQVSQRILDGMCDSGCSSCQPESNPTCRCAECAAQQSVAGSTFVAEMAGDEVLGQAPFAAKSKVVELVPAANVAPTTNRRAGLIRFSRIEPVDDVGVAAEEIIAGSRQGLPAEVEYVQPPVARITSATSGVGLKEVVDASVARQESAAASVLTPGSSSDTHQMGLLDRLKKIPSAQSPSLDQSKKL